MKELRSYIRPHAWLIGLVMLLKLLSVGFELMIPYFMELILDRVIPARNVHLVYGYGAVMVLCAVGCMLTNIFANRFSAYSSGRITQSIRHDLFERLEHLSARQLDELTVSSAESRLTSDTYNINQLLARTQRLGVRAPFMLLGGIAMMLSMDAPLALVLLCLLPLISILVILVTRRSIPLYVRQQSVLDRVVQVAQENITGIRVIKALSKSEYEKERFRKVNDELTRVDTKAGLVTSLNNPSTTLILNLGLTLVVLVGAWRVNSGSCQSGVIVAFLQYFTMILNAMLGVTKIFVLWSKGEASARRVAGVLKQPEDLTVEQPDQKVGSPAYLEFRDVSFSYTGGDCNLEHLSFRLEQGQTLGILGATGSGKSTLVKLLLRLYDPDEGQILLDGQDIRTMEPERLREKFGVVFQNDFLAEGTIADNIRFFRPLSDEAIARAAEDAQAEFIEAKADGMQAQVAVRGNNLSGGQRQRLLLARALASDPEILVLDDASSALDYRTDANLRRALHRHHHQATTVVVAQRISSLRHADLILVLDEGRVIGAGRHEDLLESCEEYRLIARTQMGDGKEDAE